MRIVPATPDGLPLEPIDQGCPTLFDGGTQTLLVFADHAELQAYYDTLPDNSAAVTE